MYMLYKLSTIQRNNLLALLERTNLTGKEVIVYNELYSILIQDQKEEKKESV